MKRILIVMFLLIILLLGFVVSADASDSTVLHLPSSLTKVESQAFKGCANIESLMIPASATTIEDAAFQDCSNLAYVFIPETVSYIADNAFEGADAALSFEVFEDTYAAQWAESHNYNYVYTKDTNHQSGNYVYSVSLGKTATIKKYVGTETGVLTVPSTIDGYKITKIGEEAFSYCPASKIVLPDTLLELEYQAFNYCDMTELVLPESLIKIGNWAFSGCRDIVNIHIPDSVTEIAGNPFYGCHGLKRITVSESNPVFRIYQNALIQKSNYKLITIPFGLIGDTLTIPDGIRIIGDCAFGYSGPDFTKLIIPDSVEEIESSAFCFSPVEYVEIGSGVRKMGYGPFTYCKSLKTVVIKDGTTVIGESAFLHCDNLETITIPDSVTYIDENAFEYDYFVSFVASPNSYATQYADEHGIPIIQ